MIEDVENQLVPLLQVRNFSLQIDEALLPNNQAIIMIFFRFLNDAGELAEEMLFARSLVTDTKAEIIFKKVPDYLQKRKIAMSNIIACSTDGAAAMVGRYRGFIAYLKETVPNLLCIHWVVYQQNLVAKNLSGRLKNVQRLLTVLSQIHSKNAFPSTLC